MKILQVTPTFVPSNFGGVKVMSHKISKTLTKRGHEVVVYTTDADIGRSRLRDIQDIKNVDGIKVRYFRNPSNLLAYKYRLFLPLGIILAAKKEIRSFDMIHLHDFRTFENIVVRHYAQKYGIPYVLQARGSLPRIMTKQKLKQIYDIFWGYRLLRDASRLIALTETEAEQYKSMGVKEDKIEIIPNAIDLSEFENLPEPGKFRRQYGLDNNQKLILYLGRIHKIKGLDLLAEAFATLSKELKHAKLAITGPDDGYLPSLKKLITDLEISDKVLFTGPLYGRAKVEAYVDADVYVLPSRYEIFGSTVLEACACGTPIVLTDRCGTANIIDGQAGFAVPYDKDALSSAILRMLSDDKMRQEFGEKGKSLVRRKFNWEKIAVQVENLYLSCLSANGGECAS